MRCKMKTRILRIGAIALIAVSMLPAMTAHADKTVYIPKEKVEEAMGNDHVSGKVTRVGHERIFIESGSRRIKIDLNDFNFSQDLDEIFEPGMQVCATGRLTGSSTLEARRITVIKTGRTFQSTKPARVTVKGKENTKVRIVD